MNLSIENNIFARCHTTIKISKIFGYKRIELTDSSGNRRNIYGQSKETFTGLLLWPHGVWRLEWVERRKMKSSRVPDFSGADFSDMDLK